MICMNQFLHTQITIIAPRIGDASFDKRNHYESTTLELSHFKKRYNDIMILKKNLGLHRKSESNR